MHYYNLSILTFAINVSKIFQSVCSKKMTDLQLNALKTQAVKTALNGDWKNAIELNKTLLGQSPNDIDTLNRLGLAYSVTGDHVNAKNTYQKVFQLDPLNMIALKNLKKLNGKNNSGKPLQGQFLIKCNFLEETGKTKVVELINIAQPHVIQTLKTGQNVDLVVKRSKIFILDFEKQYVGVLPDDIGNRLIKFIKNGNCYEAYIKSTNQNKVNVFLKEVKRATKFKNQPSFLSSSESVLEFEKPRKSRSKAGNSDNDNSEEED